MESLWLNGEDFFKKGNTPMLENLLSYAVNNFKVYAKRGELSRTMDKKAGSEEYGMGVRQKRQYSIG